MYVERSCVRARVGRAFRVHEQNHDGDSPLLAACDNGHMEVVRALLGAGAVVNQAAVRGHGVVSQSSVVACVCVGVCVWMCVWVVYDDVGRLCIGSGSDLLPPKCVFGMVWN